MSNGIKCPSLLYRFSRTLNCFPSSPRCKDWTFTLLYGFICLRKSHFSQSFPAQASGRWYLLIFWKRWSDVRVAQRFILLLFFQLWLLEESKLQSPLINGSRGSLSCAFPFKSPQKAGLWSRTWNGILKDWMETHPYETRPHPCPVLFSPL